MQIQKLQNFNSEIKDRFFSECIHAIELSDNLCRCPDHWHFFWAALKAAGLRRGIYLQQHLFDKLLNDRKNFDQRILIAGSADAGTLEVLHNTLPRSSNKYLAIDQCPTPIKLLSEYASKNNISLTTDVCDIEKSQEGPWDIILLHNTLILLPKKKRINALKWMKSNLDKNGKIICGMRYTDKIESTENDTIKECHEIQELVKSNFGNHQKIQSILLPKIYTYAHAQLNNMKERVQRQEFYSELTFVGLKVNEKYSDEKILPSITSEMNREFYIEAELMSLQHL